MRLTFGPLAAIALLGGSTVEAQTADQARLMFSLGIGQTGGGGRLWRVGNQPFIPDPGVTDTLALSRTFRRSLNVVLSGTYFPNDHWGYNFEAQLLGLGTQDACTIVVTQLSPETADLCRTIGQAERSATSAAVSGGLIYRIGSKQPIHPYIRANLGMLITQQSFIKTKGRLEPPGGEPSELTLYEDASPGSLQPYLSFGGGIVTVIGKGYQLRFEVRDNWTRVPRVDGPTARQGLEPPNSTVGKHLLTFTLGFDVVLERKRGRRY